MEFDNISLIEIFKQEAQSQGLLFEEALLSLIENPKNFSKIDLAMRAAHSLKGAAQIVGIKGVSQIAHLIEDCFVCLQKTGTILDRNHLRTILNAFETLVQVKNLSNTEILEWSQQHSPILSNLEKQITDIIQSIEPPIEKLTDERFLSLFLSELQGNLTVLQALLSTSISASEFTDTIIRAPHSIKGGACIVGFVSLARLNEKVEQWFIDIKGQTIEWTQECLEVLQKYIRLLQKIAQTPLKALEVMMGQLESSIVALTQEINAVSSKAASKKKTLAWHLPHDYNSSSTIQISAENLNRMMGLSAELLVQLKQFQLLKDSLLTLKKQDLELSNLLEKTLSKLTEPNIEQAEEILEEASQKVQTRAHQARKALESFEELIGRTNVFSENLYKSVILNCMRPFSECIQDLPRLVSHLSQRLNKHIVLDIIGKDTLIDRHLMIGLRQSLKHIIRNACDHGIESPENRIQKGKKPEGKITIRAYHNAGLLVIELSDDGNGINIPLLREKLIECEFLDPKTAHEYTKDKLLDFLFLPRFSTAATISEVSGRGVGLDVVHNFVQQERGSVRITTETLEGTTFSLQLPIMRSVIKTLVCKAGISFYAFPIGGIYSIVNVQKKDLTKRGNIYYYKADNILIPLIYLGKILNIPYSFAQDHLRILIVSDMEKKYGLIVDAILEEADLVVRPLDQRLGKIFCLSAISITSAGEPVFILDMDDIIEALNKNFDQKTKRHRVSKPERRQIATVTKEILWVDDSEIILENGSKMLKKLGYKVETAKNGEDALKKLEKNHFDLLITDLEMPKLSGEELIHTVRSSLHMSDIPFLIVSSKEIDTPSLLSNGRYCNKNTIEDSSFVQSIEELLLQKNL